MGDVYFELLAILALLSVVVAREEIVGPFFHQWDSHGHGVGSGRRRVGSRPFHRVVFRCVVIVTKLVCGEIVCLHNRVIVVRVKNNKVFTVFKVYSFTARRHMDDISVTCMDTADVSLNIQSEWNTCYKYNSCVHGVSNRKIK